MSWFKRFQRDFDKRAAFSSFQSVRINFLSDLASALKGGAPLVLAIAESAERCEDKLQQRVYKAIRAELNGGGELMTALSPWFIPSERMLLESFLQSARTNAEIGKAFDNLVNVIVPYQKLRDAQILTAAVFLAVFLACSVFVGGTGAVLIMLEGMIPLDRWPPFVRAFVDGCRWVFGYSAYIVAALVAIPIFISRALTHWSGPVRRKWDKRVPGFVMYRELQAALVMISLGAFCAAGRGISETCRQLATNASPWLRWYLGVMQVRAKDEGGVNIVEVGLFDWRLMVRVACLTTGGALPAALSKVGLESSGIVAEAMGKRLGRAQRVALLMIPVTLFCCLGVVIAMYFGFIKSLRNL